MLYEKKIQYFIFMKPAYYVIISIVTILVIGCSNNRVRKEFYSSGELKVERIYQSRDTSTYLETTFFPNGVKKSRGNYVNGIRDGLWQSGFPNGQLKVMGNYVNGKREGIWQGWFADGGERWRAEYINGIPKPIPTDAFVEAVIFTSVPEDSLWNVWYAGVTQYLRIYVEGVTPYNMSVACECFFIAPADTADYNFNIGVVPRKSGWMLFHVIHIENGNFISLFKDTIYVQPNPMQTDETHLVFGAIEEQVLLVPSFDALWEKQW